MKLLHSWAESLLIFKPDNAKKFLYVTGRALKFSYPWYLLWLLIASTLGGLVTVIVAFIGPTLENPLQPTPKFHMPFSIVLLYFFILFILTISPLLFACLSARASTHRKNFAYFKSYFSSALYFVGNFFVLFLLLFITVIFVARFALSEVLLRFASSRHYSIKEQAQFVSSAIEVVYLWPLRGTMIAMLPGLLFIWLNFYFDLPKFSFLKSLRKAFTMFIFNLPIFVLLNGLISGATYAFYHYVWTFKWILSLAKLGSYYGFFGPLIIFPLPIFLLLPIPVCIFTNLYIMKLHQQPELYFDKPIKE